MLIPTRIPDPQAYPPSIASDLALNWVLWATGMLICLSISFYGLRMVFRSSEDWATPGPRPAVPPKPPAPKPAVAVVPVKPKHHDLAEYLTEQDKAELKGWDDLVENLATDPEPKK